MKIERFITSFIDGDVSVMDVSDLSISQIRFNGKSRDISIVLKDVEIPAQVEKPVVKKIPKTKKSGR